MLFDGNGDELMTTSDQLTAQDSGDAAGEKPVALWRDPLWLGLIVIFIATSAVLIGAIAGRAAEVIDMWALAVGGLAVAAAAAASVAIVTWRQRNAARDTLSSEMLVRALPQASAVIDATGRAQAANEMFGQLFPDTQHAPLTALKRLIGGDGAAADLIGRLIAGVAAGSAVTEDVLLTDNQTGIVALRVSAIPLADQDGLALWTFEDTTVTYRAEAEIRDGQASLAETLATAPVGFYSVDQDGRFLLANDALVSWLGYAPGDLEAQGLRLHDILIAPVPQTLAHRVADGDPAAGATGRAETPGRGCGAGRCCPVGKSGDGWWIAYQQCRAPKRQCSRSTAGPAW